MDQKKILAAIILIAEFLTSIYVGINISTKNNIFLYDFVINKRFSIIDIAIASSEETVFKSQLISILLYLFLSFCSWGKETKASLYTFFLA